MRKLNGYKERQVFRGSNCGDNYLNIALMTNSHVKQSFSTDFLLSVASNLVSETFIKELKTTYTRLNPLGDKSNYNMHHLYETYYITVTAGFSRQSQAT